MNDNKQTIFVYGTLKFGFHNAGFLLNSEILGRGKTESTYALYEGALPYLTDRKIHKVKGEVYRVSSGTMDYLDRLEGHPHLYKRKKIAVQLDGGKTLNCWTYFWTQSQRVDWNLTDGEYKLNNNTLWQRI